MHTLLNAEAGRAALENRPDLLAARDAQASESARSRSLLRTMLPSLDLSYSVGDTYFSHEKVSGWSSLATLTVPLWSGLRDYSAYKVQVQSSFAAEFRVQQLQREILGSVSASQANFRLSVQQYESRLRNLSMAHRLLDQDAARFKIGRASADDLNLDLTRVTDAEILTIQGKRQAHTAYLKLLHVMGKSAL